jgi:ABC-2 type transport system permease protein
MSDHPLPISDRTREADRSMVGASSGERRSMTWYFVSIKLRILKNAFSGDKRLRFGMVVMILGSIAAAVFAWTRLWSFRDMKPWDAGNSSVVFFTLVFGAWVFGPIVTGGVDDTLDPTKMALLPLRRDELRRGFVAASLTGYAPLATAIGLTGAIAAFARDWQSVVLVSMAVVTHLLLSLTAARAMAIVLAHTARSRRGRDVSVVFASVAGAFLWLGAQTIKLLTDETYERATGILRWFPAGAIGQSVVDAREGKFGASGLRILGAAALAYFFLQVWLRGLDRLLVLPETVRQDRKKAKTGYPVLGGMVRLIGLRPWGAVMMKELRYISRSPSRRSAFIVGTVIGAPFAFVQVLSTKQSGSTSLWFAPAALLFGLGASNNLLGADAASLWMECSSGLRMRTLLTGKSLAAVPYLVMPVVVSTFALGIVSGAWEAMFVMLALALLCWGIPLGMGCIISVLAPFGQPDQANPYANRRPTAGEGCLIGFLGIAGLVVTTILALPVAVLVGGARSFGPGWSVFPALALSGVWSVLVWQVGLWWSSKYAQRHEADLLADMGARKR